MPEPETEDFYEDDEPIEQIRAILDRPPDGVTERPRTAGIAVGRSHVAASGNRLVDRAGVAVA